MVMLLFCLGTGTMAQTTSRPSLFSNQPERLECSMQSLANIFNAAEGQTITIPFSNNISFTGRVTSNIVKYSNLQSVTIQMPAYQNAVIHLSKQINDDHTVSYVGRIMQQDSKDGYVIEPSGNNYSFKKIDTDRLMEVCQ